MFELLHGSLHPMDLDGLFFLVRESWVWLTVVGRGTGFFLRGLFLGSRPSRNTE